LLYFRLVAVYFPVSLHIQEAWTDRSPRRPLPSSCQEAWYMGVALTTSACGESNAWPLSLLFVPTNLRSRIGGNINGTRLRALFDFS
jgi:hypothetical protein